MEVWWAGFIAQPSRLLVYVIATFALLIGYNNFAGIRHDADWTDVVVDSVEEFGLGIITAAGLLALLARITPDMSFEEILGKIVIEAGIVAIGFSVGTAQLGGDDEDSGRSDSSGIMSQVVISLCGAVLVAANVAPTEEIVVIAAEVGTPRLLGIIVLSFLLAILILFFSNFKQATRYAAAENTWHAVAGGIVTYALAVAASAAILWFFGRFETVLPAMMVSQTIVLSLPATLGASAGRLLLQS
jgi:putative integral membrane protein (TIGR02587 family)